MKKHLFTFLTAAALLNLASCQNAGPNANNGAVLGGLGGAGVGAIIGNQSGRPLEGALIGGAVGALGGAALGTAQDERNAQYYQQQQQQQDYNQRRSY